MAIKPHVFNEWIKRKLRAHPDRMTFLVPHAIVQHMPHCKCPKPQPARWVHMGWNANSGPQFWEYDSREFKLWAAEYSHLTVKWVCVKCDEDVYIEQESK